MSLEDIFDNNITDLKNKIEIIGSKYPNLIKTFALKKNDPHVEKMISSFALISASLEYEVAKKMSREIRSIFMNVFPDEFATVPPTGMIKIKSNIGTHFKVEKNKIIRDNNIIFKTKRDFFINDIEIKNYECIFYKNQLGININITGNNINKIENIDLMFDLHTLNKVFTCEKKIRGILINRDLYDTEFDMELHDEFSLKDFSIYDKQYCFVRLSNFSIQKGSIDKLDIFIPLKESTSNNTIIIKTNLVVVENKFSTYSSPFLLENGKECDIPEDNNSEIINVNNIITLNGKYIPHINENSNGWHLLIKKNKISIYIDNDFNETSIAEIECFNINYTLEKPYSDEYMPGTLEWDDLPSKPFKYIYQNDVSKLIQLVYLDQNSINKSLDTISDLLSIYNNTNQVTFSNVDNIEIIKPVKLANYTIPKLFNIITCITNTTNYILLRHIVEEIRKKINSKIDFIFQTKNGEMHYE